MAEIFFYHLTRTTLEQALPGLLEKTLQKGWRAVLQAGSPERVEDLAHLLWTYGRASFLPHGTAKDGHAADQPIWITALSENPNGAQALFLTDGVVAQDYAAFARICDMFDGNDPAAVEAARVRWRAAKAAGQKLVYWQQEARGWTQKAES